MSNIFSRESIAYGISNIVCSLGGENGSKDNYCELLFEQKLYLEICLNRIATILSRINLPVDYGEQGNSMKIFKREIDPISRTAKGVEKEDERARLLGKESKSHGRRKIIDGIPESYKNRRQEFTRFGKFDIRSHYPATPFNLPFPYFLALWSTGKVRAFFVEFQTILQIE